MERYKYPQNNKEHDPDKGGGEKQMEKKETWEIRVDKMEVNNQLIAEQIKNIVKTDMSILDSRIEEAINEMTNEFLKQQYDVTDLEAQIKYIVNASEHGYRVSIYAYVYPTVLPSVYKTRLIVYNAERNYVNESFTKTRNELGAKLKEQMTILTKLASLYKENEELKRKLEEAEKTIQELEKKLEEQEAGDTEQEDP